MWPKFDEICVYASVSKPDIMVFTETWLNETFEDSLLTIPGYNPPLRCDRKLRRGGGVCLYHKKTICCNTLSELCPSPSSIESLWTHFPSFKIVLLSLYVPPNLSAMQLKAITDYIVLSSDEALNHVGDCNLVILGDLNNLPTADLEQTLGLTQTVNSPTRGNAILDKIFMDQEVCPAFSIPTVLPNFGSADHFAVFIKPISTSVETPKIIKVYDYRKSNLNNFIASLQSKAWHSMYLAPASLDAKCAFFYNSIHDALQTIPYTYVEMSSHEKPWMTPKLKLLINLRYEAFRSRHFDKFLHLKVKVKEEIKKAKAAWISKLKKKPQGIWKAIKDPSKSSHVRPYALYGNCSPTDIADNMNKVFAEGFSVPTIQEFTCSKPNLNEAWNPVCNQSVVYHHLKTLKSGKAAGNDNLTPRLLKASADILVNPLTHLFSLSLSSGVVPELWKTAHVVPVPKKSCSTVRDFRPISLLPLPSKILEKIVLTSVKEKLIGTYGNNQYGFRPGSSTLLAHISIEDFVTRHLDSTSTFGVLLIAFDMKKAFDSLSHACLLKSLTESGLPQSFVSWIKSFLTSRKQRVLLNGVLSPLTVHVTSGVPQGSVLAPYLFACHMGSLKPRRPSSCMLKYADDVNILCPFNRDSSVQAVIQSEIQNMQTWCATNGLSLNDDKTQILLFKKPKVDYSVFDTLASRVSTHLNILGVFFNHSLTWDTHVDEVTKRASRRIHVLRQLKKIPSVTKKDLVQVYQCYILSILHYNDSLFTAMKNKNHAKLNKIIKRCHRIICEPSCTCEAFPTFETRQLNHALDTFSLMLSPSHLLHSLIPHTLPRTRHFYIHPARTERRLTSFIPFCCRKHNSIRPRYKL